MDIKKQLNLVFEDDIDESITPFDVPLEIAVPASVIYSVIVILTLIFTMFNAMKKSAKENKQLSKRIKEILKDGRPWRVLIIKVDEVENAFAMIRPFIFITEALYKRFKNKPRLLEAVMLHEASHITHKDIYKTSPFMIPIITTQLLLLIANAPTIILINLYLIAVLIFMTFQPPLSRRNERIADEFVAKYGYGKDLAAAFKEIVKTAPKSKPRKRFKKAIEKLERIMAQHPPVKERIKAALENQKIYNAAATASANAKLLFASIKKIVFGV